ncbi:MAG: hypothetical protein MJ188_10520 [Treponema sp.]|nr:hypothetical protein [Treponema sp.]
MISKTSISAALNIAPTQLFKKVTPLITLCTLFCGKETSLVTPLIDLWITTVTLYNISNYIKD